MDGPWDVVIVGAGILGLATARELLRRNPEARLLVLERESSIAAHQTGHNSGVIHAGIYYTPGSLKAQLCVSGARELYDFCDRHGIAYERCGKLIIALDESELPGLEELHRRGVANRVPGLRRLGAAELREIEPYATGIAALHSPATGIVDFGAVARAMASEITAAGAVVQTGVAVRSLSRSGGTTVVQTSAGAIPAARVVACAGAWSDRLAEASGEAPDPRIIPFRGGYLRLREPARHLVRSLIYPVPDPSLPFLGVHLTKRWDGEIWLGPSALLAPSRTAYRLSSISRRDLGDTLRYPGTWRMARKWWRTGLTELHLAANRRAFVAACARYVPSLSLADVTDGPAGIRAQAVARDGKLLDDFAFADGGGVLHVRNAPSPAATSSLAIARVIADRLEAT
ncbi:L-2-hydroxyglutarate oxidase [Candidatus Solirubrobacter pratensis]|uniref:L-2-hydroxyglutarate oxidase n=1 Tax=Candidatus Solirubrobacter pratensis TaxID=1298857 RepID=UPI00056590CC|nr:L-2-hydroxyglutarate oxidase [Candidatus Solirubrobacter pratensis]